MPDAFPQPPPAPEFQPRFVLYPHQYLTIPLLFLVPLLALLGVFGERAMSRDAANDTLSLHVEFAPTTRYELSTRITISVTNVGTDTLENVEMGLNRQYIDMFSQADFAPSVDFGTPEDYVVTLDDLAPGTTRVVVVEVRSRTFGWHSGTVHAKADDQTMVRVPLETFVFP